MSDVSKRSAAEGVVSLRDWQSVRLPILRGMRFAPSQYVDDVTIVAYSFPADGGEKSFDWLECAIRHSWSVLGMLKTVIVANRRFPKLDSFAFEFANWVEVQVETSLAPGKIESMSADCNGRLHLRFGTPYCLIVQDDGFPLNDNLKEFLGKYDYIGAPYVRIAWWRSVICCLLGMWVSNGGFSMRSKRICEAAAYWWERKYKACHPCEKTVDDLYYTKTLPLRHLSYRLKYKIAGHRTALRFSYDDIVCQPVKMRPFGFHRTSTFETLQLKSVQ